MQMHGLGRQHGVLLGAVALGALGFGRRLSGGRGGGLHVVVVLDRHAPDLLAADLERGEETLVSTEGCSKAGAA